MRKLSTARGGAVATSAPRLARNSIRLRGMSSFFLSAWSFGIWTPG